MDDTLSFETAARLLQLGARHTLDAAIADAQHPDHGALIRPDWGIPDPAGSVGVVSSCAWALLVRLLRPDLPQVGPGRPALLAAARAATAYLLRTQRPTGRIDLLDCNYDSSPDNAFAVQALASFIAPGRAFCERDAEWAALLAEVETLARRMVEGMLEGGFHTPNHRWVIAGALSMAAPLWPDIEVAPVIRAYMDEGIDVDADGAYIEHSSGVYDAICNRSLLMVHRYTPCPEALSAVVANLRFNLSMLNPDGTIETGLSRRQDYGAAPIPASLAMPYLICGALIGDDEFVDAAHFIWNAGGASGARDATGMAWALLHAGAVQDDAPLPVADCRALWPANGVARIRRGRAAATLFRGAGRAANVRFGRATLAAVRVNQSYFGVGAFVADVLEDDGERFRLHSRGDWRPHRPGYELPLGRPVPAERYAAMLAEREWRPVPPCAMELVAEELDSGLALALRTLDGLEGVTAQIALDFEPGGVWETDDCCLEPKAGQIIFLKRGHGRMRYGRDLLEVGPGAFAHRMWRMRDADPAPDLVRVLLTFRTPIEHRLLVRWRTEL